MTAAPKLRWPIANVVDLLRLELGPKGDADDLGGYSNENAAAILELNPRTWLRYKSDGDVSDVVADRIAAALHLNPTAIWPDWDTRYAEALAAAEGAQLPGLEAVA